MLTWDQYNLDGLDLTDENQAVWYLERMIKYGLGEAKIERDLLERFFQKLQIPENTRAFFELLLWNKPF